MRNQNRIKKRPFRRKQSENKSGTIGVKKQHLQTCGYSASVGGTALHGYRLRSMCPGFRVPITGSTDSIAGLLYNVNTYVTKPVQNRYENRRYIPVRKTNFRFESNPSQVPGLLLWEQLRGEAVHGVRLPAVSVPGRA